MTDDLGGVGYAFREGLLRFDSAIAALASCCVSIDRFGFGSAMLPSSGGDDGAVGKPVGPVWPKCCVTNPEVAMSKGRETEVLCVAGSVEERRPT